MTDKEIYAQILAKVLIRTCLKKSMHPANRQQDD